MVRAPCCEKMGLKKGPWTSEEDRILISHIQNHGHSNWRALPQLAGLARCGKSCRLRWMNYLRPDIKRGNFTKKEEETIIELHELLGNRWSAIAARLHGRTDNEIKNIWHTHLKKRLKNYQPAKNRSTAVRKCGNAGNTPASSESPARGPYSPQPSSSDLSSSTETSAVTMVTVDSNNTNNNTNEIKNEQMDYKSPEYFAEIDESFWSEDLMAEYSNVQSEFSGIVDKLEFGSPLSPAATSSDGCSMDFWYNLFLQAGDLTGLPEL